MLSVQLHLSGELFYNLGCSVLVEYTFIGIYNDNFQYIGSINKKKDVSFYNSSNSNHLRFKILGPGTKSYSGVDMVIPIGNLIFSIK